MLPGLTTLTRTPSAAHSSAICRLSETSAALLGPYDAPLGRPHMALSEPMLTIEADGLLRRCGRQLLATISAPSTLILKREAQSSTEQISSLAGLGIAAASICAGLGPWSCLTWA